MSPETNTEAPRVELPDWTKQYAPGVPAQIEVPQGSLADMFDTSVRTFRRRPALSFFGKTLSYRELGEQVSRVAQALVQRGVKKGHRVAMVLPNCPQAVIAFYAIQRIGAVAVMHNPLYTGRELRRMFEDHAADVAIVWAKAVETIQDFPYDVRPHTIVSVDPTQAMPLKTRLALRLPLKKAKEAREALTAKVRGVVDFREFASASLLPGVHSRPDNDDPAAVLYTSGTTGYPKGVVLRHRNLLANAVQGGAWMPDIRPGRETSYAALPIFHAFGMTLSLIFGISKGMHLVLFPKPEIGLVLKEMRRLPATVLYAVPPLFDRIAKAAAEEGIALTQIRYALSGAMTLSADIAERWEKATGHILVEGYGMTESSPVTFGNPFGENRRIGYIGVPFPSTEVRIVDVDDASRDVPLGEPGELLVRGPQVFSGYLHRPEETAQVLTEDGWLHTGDVVAMESDGFVRVVDRKKDIIITGGFNVTPSEVEQVLDSHPAVEKSTVVALPGKDSIDQVAAAVVLLPGEKLGETVDPQELRKYCRARLTGYKVPRSFHQLDEFPQSLIGKILRREVASLLKQQSEGATAAPAQENAPDNAPNSAKQ
ncbi:long-chain-fatty-acid--CoA ligase [Dermabacteraceae bacterium P7054]